MKVRAVAITQPLIEGLNTIGDFVAYTARVSNPANQMNSETAPKLLRYLAKHKHWSPFEMAHVVMEIETTRDIARQILRHRSFSFQEFSQRYADVASLGQMFELSEARLQDTKNRQNSIQVSDVELQQWWREAQIQIMDLTEEIYKEALERGIAKEQARKGLPEGLTKSRLYMAGSVRSWIHYCILRKEKGTQAEHREVAVDAWNELLKLIPELSEIVGE